MDSKKTLGIWMDHSKANLFTKGQSTCHKTISSDFSNTNKSDALNKSESLMHNKEQQHTESYFKNISDEIVKFNHVLLFGPTDAKTELHNFLNKDLHFKSIQFDVESADKMTDNEQLAYVKNHFEMN